MQHPQQLLSLFNQLVEQIEKNLGDEINALAIAGEFGLSPWHFQRLFKSLVGDSLGAYIRGRRLTRAAQLLTETDKGILDIAVDLAYNSHEAFSRAFKTQYTITPKEMRAQKPSFTLQDKPVLNHELLQFLKQRIDMEPQITTVPAQRVLGYELMIDSPFVDPVHCTTIAEPWMKLLGSLANDANLHDRKLVGITLSESGNFTESTVNYVAGIVVDDDREKPADMVETHLPSQEVAIFHLSTNVANDNLKQKVDSIYGYWLMNSEYHRGSGNDYELFTNIRNAMVGDFDANYVIPIAR